ncbi:MAG: hypothetical protein B7X07_06410 [Actinobacteria bacterium 21-64-8]|nr:MAG: hypothetical protein B7X07_06410 [Actinobacteria bacterium 21-64-8]
MMLDGVALILAPRLPVDEAGGRIATTHALVRVGREEERFTYAPILIKNHEAVEHSATRSTLSGTLEAPWPADATLEAGVTPRSTPPMTRSGVALAHATRVLQALGHGDEKGRAGLIDRQRQLWWFALNGPQLPRFNLSTYDVLYATRVETLRAHDAWLHDGGDFPTSPYWHRECLECPYASHCERELDLLDDVSLVRFTNQEQQSILREHGVSTRRELAQLNPTLVRTSRTRPPVDTPSVTTIEAALAKSFDKLDELIYRARAHRWNQPLRIVDAERMGCARADVEVDVDMESYDNATYLWGATVHVRQAVDGITAGYFAFAEWGELNRDSEAANFARFWRWLSELQVRCDQTGQTFAAYCFWAQAEDGAMNRAVHHPLNDGPTMADLEFFRHATPSRWIDLHDVAKRQVQTEGPLGLKVLARAAGFTWRDENPSGEASMLWYEIARSDRDDANHFRQRLLDYNEDDCRATRALRDWLNGPARELPHRDDLGWPA